MQNDQLEVLEWLQCNNYPWSENVCRDAAQYGHFELLKWLRKNGCPYNKNTREQAAANGDLEMLKWLLKQFHRKTPSSYT